MTRESQWQTGTPSFRPPAHRTPPPAVRPTRRVRRDAARLLAAQSALGNQNADTVTAVLHRAGYNMRPEPTGWLIVWGLLALTFAAMLVVFVLWTLQP